MQIVNPQVKKDISEGKPIKLDLGSGGAPRQGMYALDHLPLDGVDIISDLNKAFDLLPDNCVEYIYSRHALEHVQELFVLMSEIHRVTRPGGTIEIIVPHFSNVYGYSDPTHVRFFGLYSMFYFVSPENQPRIRKVPSYYSDVSFDIESVTIQFYRSGIIDKVFVPFLSRIVNINISCQDFYERRLAGLYHAWQIRYLMKPDK
jgi:hypothetical protein